MEGGFGLTDAIVPVGHKPIVARSAVATGVLELSSDSADAIRNGLVTKGDVLEASMVAAIQAVKETWFKLKWRRPSRVRISSVPSFCFSKCWFLKMSFLEI